MGPDDESLPRSRCLSKPGMVTSVSCVTQVALWRGGKYLFCRALHED